MNKTLSLTLTAGLLMAACTGNGQAAQNEKDSTNCEQAITGQTEEPAAKEFILGNGKLGPIECGMAISSLPKQVEGLYDKFEQKSEECYDIDESWIEEFILFTKGGVPVFRADIAESKITSFSLLEGSSRIKTPDGICVGYNARELFKKKKMDWETWYMGEVFASDGKYTYFVPSDELVNVDTPEKAEDFKPNAKVCKICYQTSQDSQ